LNTFFQKTISKEVSVLGIGIHTAHPVNMKILPAKANQGIVFYRKDKQISIPFHYKNVISTNLSTNIGLNNVSVSTTEHLMSALFAYGIDNAIIELDGDEVPILDGSATGFCMLLNEAKSVELAEQRKYLKITKTIKKTHNSSYVEISPNDPNKETLDMEYSIDFNIPFIGTDPYIFSLSKESFIKEISSARTFGLMKDIKKMKDMNLIKGGDFNNAIVFDDNGVVNSEKLRFKDEPLRHKILDAIGDLSILGMPIIGKYKSFAGSHYLNHELTKAIYEDNAFELVELESF